MGNRTQQQIGAQVRAAGQVREKQGEFFNLLNGINGNVDTIRSQYQGQGATAFYTLVANWMQDASQIIREFDAFADRLTTVDKTTQTSQEDQDSTFRGATTGFSTRLG